MKGRKTPWVNRKIESSKKGRLSKEKKNDTKAWVLQCRWTREATHCITTYISLVHHMSHGRKTVTRCTAVTQKPPPNRDVCSCWTKAKTRCHQHAGAGKTSSSLPGTREFLSTIQQTDTVCVHTVLIFLPFQYTHAQYTRAKLASLFNATAPKSPSLSANDFYCPN